MSPSEFRREMGRRAREHWSGFQAANHRRREAIRELEGTGGMYPPGYKGRPRIPAVSGQEANYWLGRWLEARSSVRLLLGRPPV